MWKIKSTGVWKHFLVSFFLPLIGGMVVYFKEKNKELTTVCLTLSLLHPIIIGFVLGFCFGLLGFGVGEIESYSSVLWLPVAIILTLVLVKVFEENTYRYFIPVWYFGLFGAVYSYCFGYKKNKRLRRDVILFFLGQSVFFILLGLVEGFLGVLEGSIEGQVQNLEIVANETVTVPPEHYYLLSFYSPAGTRLKMRLKSTETIRFVLLRPLECIRFEEGEDYYPDEQIDVVELSSIYTLTSEGDWCIALWNLLPSNVSVRVEGVLWYENL